MKNHFRPAFDFNDAHINAMYIQVKIYASLVPPKTCQKYAQYLGDKNDTQQGR